MGKDAPEAGGVVELAFLHGGDVQIAAVKESLKLLKRDDAVNIFMDLGQLELRLLGGARPDKDRLCAGVKLLYALGDRRHGRHVVRDVLRKRGVLLFDEADKGRAAGACQEAPLRKLSGLGIGHHVRAQRGLNDLAEAKRLYGRDDLAGLCIGELADDGGRDDGIDALTQAQKLYGVKDERLVRERAPRALVHARAAGDALFIIYPDGAVLIHGYGAGLAGVLAGALSVVDSAVGAGLRAQAAVDALAFINIRVVELVVRYRAAAAGILTAVGKTAAILRDGVAARRAVVAGDVDGLDDVGVVLIPAGGHFDALSKYGALFIDAAAHRRHLAGDDLLGDIKAGAVKVALPSVLGNGAQDLVFQMLHLCIKFVHRITPLSYNAFRHIHLPSWSLSLQLFIIVQKPMYLKCIIYILVYQNRIPVYIANGVIISRSTSSRLLIKSCSKRVLRRLRRVMSIS